MRLPAQYTEAKRALSEIVHKDEVKDWRDKATALEAYAYQAKDPELVQHAVEVKRRAERRLGELMENDRQADRMSKGAAATRGTENPASLSDQGIDKNLAKRARVAARMTEEEFEEDLGHRKELGQAAVLGNKEVVAKAREALHKEKSERREERLEEISRNNTELDTSVRYPIIYADPPWRYENPPMGSTTRSIENHYPTMTLEEICELPVSDLAGDDALLYLWATAPKLAECFEVIQAWDFEYRTCMVWDKEKIGMGYYARNQHELLLVCRRGAIPPPETGTQPSSIYREPRGEHSAKPLFFYEMIEQAYPSLQKIELFSRSPREGWAAWGNQA